MRSLISRVTLVAALAAGLASCGPKGETVTADDMTQGNPNAKVTVVEYASASCAHCARWNKDVYPAFKAKYIDTGKVNYVYREILTPPQEVAAASFLLFSCSTLPTVNEVSPTWLLPISESRLNPPIRHRVGSSPSRNLIRTS